jgi:hypothetical protein
MANILAMDPVEGMVGLCATCRWSRRVEGARSTFYLCERSFTDPRFARYPRLPVLRCPGFTPRDEPPAPPEKTQ